MRSLLEAIAVAAQAENGRRGWDDIYEEVAY